MTIVPDSLLIQLTGFRRQCDIRRWLDKQKIPYLVSGKGWPRVLESSITERLGGKPSPVKEPQLRLRNG